MDGFVKRPNLPIDCKTVIIGEKYYKILSKPLKKLGISTLIMPKNPDIAAQISCHADMSVCHAGEGKLFLAPFLNGSELEQELKNRGFAVEISDKMQSKEYPNDVTMNICAVGDKLFCGKNADEDIIKYFTSKAYNKVLVRQGYARCSVCIVDENSIITADRRIGEAAAALGMDVLNIAPGFIELEGYDEGFIGGSAFKISSDKLAFTGGLDALPDRERIIDFIGLHNVKPVFLTDAPLFDIGGAIPITER